jgi:hypothetical protein
MGVATGTSIQSTNFVVPWNVELGDAEIYVVANGIASAPVCVNVWRWIIWWPFDELMVNRLIGSLADGPLYVLGPNGPVPVDPWGPKYLKAAEAAWGKVFDGIHELQHLGNELNATRMKEAIGKPVAIDLEAEKSKEAERNIGINIITTARKKREKSALKE